MIQYLEVKGLNNRLDDEFEFNEDLNIFTGANGSGKTTLLKLIWYLISGNLERILLEIPFHSVSLRTDLFALSITRVNSDEVQFVSKENTFSRSVNFTIAANSGTGNLEKQADAEEIGKLNTDIANAMKSSLFFPTFRRIEGGFSTSHIPNKYIPIEPSTTRRRVYSYRMAEDLREAISELTDVVSVHEHKFIVSISTDDISALLPQKYANISQNIDKLQVESSQEITQKIKDYFDNQKESEVKESQKARLVLDKIQKRVEQVTSNRERLLKPFSVLSDLIQNILQYKSVNVSGQVVRGDDPEGITFNEGAEGITLSATKGAISSDKLSSGEKQMLSFLCYNAFYNNTPIFIDEPELSLHVDWQRRLFPTLLEQGQNNQFFVATHSPFIYTKYPDKEFLLDEDRGES